MVSLSEQAGIVVVLFSIDGWPESAVLNNAKLKRRAACKVF